VPNLHARTLEITNHLWVWLRSRLLRRSVPSAPSAPWQWSLLVRTVIFAYVALSIVIWPLMLMALIPMVYGVVVTYPALWSTAPGRLGDALAAGDAAAALAQLQVLFMPTLMVINLAFLLKRVASRLASGRGAAGGSIKAEATRQNVAQI
jgi:hypothetical protein